MNSDQLLSRQPSRFRIRPANFRLLALLLLLICIAAACRSPHYILELGELKPTDLTAEEFLAMPPDYSDSLQGVSGAGRLLVSQPGGSDRLTLEYHSDRNRSLVTFRNRIGMEGGQVLTTRDSILVYNRIDQRAEQVSVDDADLTELGALATVNLTELFHFPVTRREIESVYEDENHYIAFTADGWRITIDRESGFVLELNSQQPSAEQYSRIQYERYEEVDGFYLPRRITIFSRGEETRLVLLVQRLEVNPELPPLEVDLPDEVQLLTL